MEVELPFGVESALRAVQRVAPSVAVEMRVRRGVVEQVELQLSRAEATPEVLASLAKAGFRSEADSRSVWTKERRVGADAPPRAARSSPR